jgi:hypothetical protein
MQNRITEIREMRIGDIADNPNNWRTHPEKQEREMKGVLDEVGQAGVVLAYHSERNEGNLTFIDGHLRKQLDPDEIWNVAILDLDDEEADKLLLSYDYLTGQAGIEPFVLKELVDSVQMSDEGAREIQASQNLLAETLIQEIMANQEKPDDPGPEIDKAEELRKKWGVESGQLWQLGDHRIICGDCTDKEVVDRLMGGRKAGLGLTDPPYGIGYEYDGYKDIEGHEYLDFCATWFGLLFELSDLIIITTGWRYKDYWYGHNPSDELVWFDKTKQSGGKSYHLRKSEPIFIWGKVKHKFDWDVLEFQSDREGIMEFSLREFHTCPKPLDLWGLIIENQSDISDIVLDIFLGSGTTLIACERLNRKCYGIEIEPKYIAVTLERWAEMTNREPVLLK